MNDRSYEERFFRMRERILFAANTWRDLLNHIIQHEQHRRFERIRFFGREEYPRPTPFDSSPTADFLRETFHVDGFSAKLRLASKSRAVLRRVARVLESARYAYFADGPSYVRDAVVQIDDYLMRTGSPLELLAEAADA